MKPKCDFCKEEVEVHYCDLCQTRYCDKQSCVDKHGRLHSETELVAVQQQASD